MVKCISGEHVGGSLYAFLCTYVCLFVTHTMLQDHTAILVCGISRLKIGPTVEEGQEQQHKRGKGEGEEEEEDEDDEEETRHALRVHSS